MCVRECQRSKTKTAGPSTQQVLVTHFIWCQKVKCQGHKANKCNVAIIVATNKLQTRSSEGAAVTVEYRRDSI